MDIRKLTLTLFIATALCSAPSAMAMEEGMKKVGKEVADHAAVKMLEAGIKIGDNAGKKILEAGTKVIDKIPKNFGIQISPANLWYPLLSVAGAISIYKGISQSLSTYWMTDEELSTKKKNRNNLYLFSASKIVAGLISLVGSYAIWCNR